MVTQADFLASARKATRLQLFPSNSSFYNMAKLHVANCTTKQQTPIAAKQKRQFKPQTLGCGCAKAFFPTTTKQKKSAQISFHCWGKL
jgi:hypothetical protein